MQIFFGPGTVECIEPWLASFGKVLVVAGRSSGERSGALKDLVNLLESKGVSYEVYKGVSPNPTDSIVDEAAEVAWRSGAQAVVAVGGGSAIDTAKLAAAIAVSGGRAREYLRGERSPRGSLPVAAVNLTHGTGSEADRYAVATVEETREKVGVASDHLYPAVSVDDPRYTLSMPREQVVYTTLDALYHALESSTAILTSPYAGTLGEEVLKLVLAWLPKAVADLQNLEARYWLLYASMLAGIAIDNARTHLVHAMEHALSGLNPKLAHGAGLGMLGPAIVERTYKVSPSRAHRLLKHLDPELRPVPEDAKRAREALERFQKAVGFAETLSDYGFGPDDAQRVVELVTGPLSATAKLAPFEVTKDLVREIFLELL